MGKQLYVSVDVETDGPIPGVNSMLSIGAAAFTEEGNLVGTFYANLELAEGASPNEDTMRWWSTQPEAWAAHRTNLVSPALAMEKFSAWVIGVAEGAKPVFVAYPAGFDFTFSYWNLIRYTGGSPFSFSALDIKSYAAGKLGIPYREVSKKTLSKFVPEDSPHTHIAVDDAVEQGRMFINLLRS